MIVRLGILPSSKPRSLYTLLLYYYFVVWNSFNGGAIKGEKVLASSSEYYSHGRFLRKTFYEKDKSCNLLLLSVLTVPILLYFYYFTLPCSSLLVLHINSIIRSHRILPLFIRNKVYESGLIIYRVSQI